MERGQDARGARVGRAWDARGARVKHARDAHEARMKRAHKRGQVAHYIPQLASVDVHQFGISVCLASGEQLSAGEVKEFCKQHLAPYKQPQRVEDAGLTAVVGADEDGEGAQVQRRVAQALEVLDVEGLEHARAVRVTET